MAYIETIVECYLRTTPRCDINFLMDFYRDDAELITGQGVQQGKMAVRMFLTQFYGNPVEGYPQQFELLDTHYGEDVAQLTWRCGEALPFVCETFHLKDGLIKTHTMALQAGPE